MFIAMNRFRVAKGSEADFEHVWLSRDSHLDKVPGFAEFHLLKGPEAEDFLRIVIPGPRAVVLCENEAGLNEGATALAQQSDRIFARPLYGDQEAQKSLRGRRDIPFPICPTSGGSFVHAKQASAAALC